MLRQRSENTAGPHLPLRSEEGEEGEYRICEIYEYRRIRFKGLKKTKCIHKLEFNRQKEHEIQMDENVYEYEYSEENSTTFTGFGGSETEVCSPTQTITGAQIQV